MPTYTVTSPIKFKRERIEIGEPVVMSEKDAQPLIALGALEAPRPVPAEKSEGKDKGKKDK